MRVNFIYILFALRISFEICYFITSFLNQKHVYYNNLDYLSMITAAVVRSWRTLCLFWHPFFFTFYYNYFLSLPIPPFLVFSMFSKIKEKVNQLFLLAKGIKKRKFKLHVNPLDFYPYFFIKPELVRNNAFLTPATLQPHYPPFFVSYKI